MTNENECSGCGFTQKYTLGNGEQKNPRLLVLGDKLEREEEGCEMKYKRWQKNEKEKEKWVYSVVKGETEF